MSEQNERDVVATEEMIRNLRAGTFQKLAMGLGIGCGVLFLGAAILVSSWKSGNDPEVLQEALRHMPPLNVTVKLDPDSRTVKLEQPAMVTLDRPSVIPGAVANNGSNDPAISTSVTVFKTVPFGNNTIVTGWKFANGAAKAPDTQYCYFRQTQPNGVDLLQDVAKNGQIVTSITGVADQQERFAKCQWFSGSLS